MSEESCQPIECSNQDSPEEIRKLKSELRREISKRKSFENLFNNIFNSSIIGLYIVQKGKFVFCSPEFERDVGYNKKELVKMRSLDMVFPADHDLVREKAVDMLKGGGTTPYEFRIIKKSGEVIWVLERVVSIKYKGRKAVLSYFMDITQRKNLEQELNDRSSKLEASLDDLKQKTSDLERSNAELERFAYIASHDLQEPLRMVSSYTQLLEDRYKDRLDADAHDFINYAVDGAKRMQRLINDLLMYSRVGTRGKPFQPTDCKNVLNNALDNLDIAIRESRAKVTYGSLPVVMADEGQLVQLFQNLVANAIKFSGKKVPRIHISAKLKGDECILSVKDNGIGIDHQYFERIFVIFQRLNGNQYTGTGLGLAISKKIVERHGGKIWIDSQSGRGSTFYFMLPAIDKAGGSKQDDFKKKQTN